MGHISRKGCYNLKKMFCLILALVLLLGLCACMSDEDKAKLRDYEEQGEDLIKDYVQTHYEGARVYGVDCWIYRTDSGIPTPHPTTFVSAKIRYQGETYYVLTDVETGQCWDTLSADRLQEELVSRVCTLLGTDETPQVTFTCLPRDLAFYHAGGDDCKDQRFFSRDITLEEVLSGETYSVSLAVYYDGHIDHLQDKDLSSLLNGTAYLSKIFVGQSSGGKVDVGLKVTSNDLPFVTEATLLAQRGIEEGTVTHDYQAYDRISLDDGIIAAWVSYARSTDSSLGVVEETTTSVGFTPLEPLEKIEGRGRNFYLVSDVGYMVHIAGADVPVYFRLPGGLHHSNHHLVSYGNLSLEYISERSFRDSPVILPLSDGDCFGVYRLVEE